MKNRKIEVLVSNADVYNQLTSSKKKNGDKVKHEALEVDFLNQRGCVKLTELQQAMLAKKISKQDDSRAKATAEVESLLIDPNLMNKMVQEVSKNVAGEEDTIMTIGLNACGRLVANASKTSYNCIPNDESGAGKDYCTENTLKVFVPEDKLVIRTRISPVVLNYWHNPRFEPEWTWDEKVLYIKDVSDEVLNSPVLKTFTSDATNATIVINQMAIDLETKGKPCVFATTANSTPKQEQLRRFALIPLDSSEDQTKRIKSFHAKRAVQGNKPEKDMVLVEAMKVLGRVKVAIPYAELLGIKFPDKLITRTIFGSFIDLIKASAALHQFQRKKDMNGFVVANFQDYGYARQALKKITAKGNLIPLTNNQKKLLAVIDKELDLNNEISRNHSFWVVSEIAEKVSFLNQKNLYENLDLLANNGFLKKGEKEVITSKTDSSDGERTSSKFKMAYCIQDQEDFVLPSVAELEAEWLQNSDNKDKDNNNNKSNNNNNKNNKDKNLENNLEKYENLYKNDDSIHNLSLLLPLSQKTVGVHLASIQFDSTNINRLFLLDGSHRTGSCSFCASKAELVAKDESGVQFACEKCYELAEKGELR